MRLSDCRDLPGPGDACTWGAPMGHPMDPRTPDDADSGYLALIEEIEADIAKARTALTDGDYPAVESALISIKGLF